MDVAHLLTLFTTVHWSADPRVIVLSYSCRTFRLMLVKSRADLLHTIA